MSERITKKEKRKLVQDGVIDLNGAFRSKFYPSSYEPKTPAQKKAFEFDNQGYNLLLTGSAGTGKSFLGLYFGLHKVMDKTTPYEKVTIFRSAVPTRNIGFQPGTKEEKESVFETPYPGLCNKIFARGDAYQILKQKGMLEFTSTSYNRSLTIENSVVIIDESQNMTFHELDTIITRGGENCRFIFCGDLKQKDIHNSGFDEFMKILINLDAFKCVTFTTDDVVRSGLVKAYLIEKEKQGH